LGGLHLTATLTAYALDKIGDGINKTIELFDYNSTYFQLIIKTQLIYSINHLHLRSHSLHLPVNQA